VTTGGLEYTCGAWTGAKVAGGAVAGGAVAGGSVAGGAVAGGADAGLDALCADVGEVVVAGVVADVAGVVAAVDVALRLCAADVDERAVPAEDRPGRVSATATDRQPADSRAPAATQVVARDTRASAASRSNSLLMSISIGMSR